METIADTATVVKPRPYQSVNRTWPKEIPPLDPQEAISAAKRLWRIGTGKAFKGPVVTNEGHRRKYSGVCPIAKKVRAKNGRPDHTTLVSALLVNPKGHHFGGWRDLVHDLSHSIHRRVNPSERPHSPRHERLEKMLINEVVSRGWLDGKLKPKPKPPQPPVQVQRRARIIARIGTWETKQKRAETALKKLRQQKAYYDRVLG